MAIQLLEWQTSERLGASAKSTASEIRHHRRQKCQIIKPRVYRVRQSLSRDLDEKTALLGKRKEACQSYRPTRFL